MYRGVLDSGQVVAIKRANMEAIQRNTEFYNEIELLSRCHHRNLVALVGYCCDEEEQMLVYEFMEGGTLHEHLHADAKDSMNFVTRLKIALGSAKGILYLHTEADPPIFHRDIKSNNILLDSRRQAKVADFGLSRLAPDFQDELESGGDTQSHVSTVVKGTPVRLIANPHNYPNSQILNPKSLTFPPSFDLAPSLSSLDFFKASCPA